MKILFICRNINCRTREESYMLNLLSEKFGQHNVQVFEIEVQKDELPDFKDFDQIIFSRHHLNGLPCDVDAINANHKQVIFTIETK